MKFLERGADGQFGEKALTRKEVFDIVVQLSSTSVARDRRGYRHGHTSHTALGARPTRSDNVYHTPSQSPLPPPTRAEAGGGGYGVRGGGAVIGEVASKSMTGAVGGHGGGGGRGNTGNRLTFRDMRQIDPKFSSKAAIWVREEAMLVNLENIRAIILHDRLFLFDPDSEAVRSSLWHIEKTLAQNVESNFNPFEFRALEGILIHTCLTLESDLSVIEPMLRGVLSQLPLQINNESLESLHKLEQRLKEYEARARKVQQAIQAVLDDDEDMADMYLSEKQKRPGVARHILSHNDVEMLLETYLQQVDDISSRAELLQQAIDDTENLVEMHLDAIQNRVLLMNLMVTSVTTAFSFGALLTAVFGMNVAFPGKAHTREQTGLKYFLITCGVLVCVVVLIFVGIILWCQKKGLFSGKLPGQHRKSAKNQAMQLGTFGQQQEHQQMGGTQMMHSMTGSSTSAPWQMSVDPVDVPSVPFGSSGDTSFGGLFKSFRGRQHGASQKRRFDWIPNIPASRSRSTSALAGQEQRCEPFEHRNNQSRLRLGISARLARRRERQNAADMGINYGTLPVTHRDITDDKPHAL